MNPIKSIRARYVMALSILAMAIFATYFLMQHTIERQKNYGRVIHIAGNQIGLTSRIAFFISQMDISTTAEEYNTANQQVGRAINLMRRQHTVLLNGDPGQDIPRIMSPLLDRYYYAQGFAVDGAVGRFLDNAETINKTEYEAFSTKSANYAYVLTNGPYILDPLLNAVVQEYENFARDDIKRLQDIEALATAAVLALLLLEALFIFHPMDRKIQRAFQVIREKSNHLAEEKERAEQASRSKSAFLSNMSHELRTPLNAIIGFSDCLEAGIYGPLRCPKQSESIANIRNSGAHLLSLLEDILDISMTDTGKIILSEATASINDMIAQSVDMVRTAAAKAEISLTIDSNDPSLALNVDEHRVQQILFNLLSNAVKFTPPGGAVQIGSCYLSDGRVGVYVTDTGIGMTLDEIEIAQERFGRAEDVFTRQHDGAGLGLPLVIELMACHDGTVRIESIKGQGTTVTVAFPRQRIINVMELTLVS